MRNLLFPFAALTVGLAACTSSPAPETSAAAVAPASAPAAAVLQSSASVSAEAAPAPVGESSAIPASYKDIRYPEFKYVAPYPKDYRVEISEGVTGYIVSDRSLPLVNFTVMVDNPRVPAALKDVAASEMVGSMFRRGGSTFISAHALDDSLEFISAGISTSVGTWTSSFGIDCLSKDFPAVLDMAKKVTENPAFDKEQLEIVKSNLVTAYAQRYDTPAKVLSALRLKVNYVPNPRMWDANEGEYKKVTSDDVKRLSAGAFAGRRIIFALSGDVEKDSAVAMLKQFFAGWKTSPAADTSLYAAPETAKFLHKPGTYVVDKDISQANISINLPFVKRPHPDYYPAAVANFILGGGSFSSRLMTRVRSDEGLAYHVGSSTGNDYRDTAAISISLQTKVESAAYAIRLIGEEIDKLAKDGPSEEELSLAKKTLIESLPSEFDSPSSTAIIFAKNELLGKSFDHYLDYVNEVNAVTAEQVKAMIAKYFVKSEMTISVVGPVAKLDSLKPFTVVPLDSLECR